MRDASTGRRATWRDRLGAQVALVRYNLKIIFGGKFLYFLLGALGFYLLIVGISLFDAETYPELEDAFVLLLFPGLLLVFYPTVFGIQNDVDARTIELLFGIPNYRYRVWLLRFAVIIGMVFTILLLLAGLTTLVYVPVPMLEMTAHLMVSLTFLGATGFLIATLVRNGNGAAGVMVLVILAVWILGEIFNRTAWQVFLNPYDKPNDLTPPVWSELLLYNRIYLVVGTILAILGALLRLQKRERFI